LNQEVVRDDRIRIGSADSENMQHDSTLAFHAAPQVYL
jgi:hypothetical protein